MTLANMLLQKLGDWAPPANGCGELRFAHEASGVAVALLIQRVDTMSCQLAEITVSRPLAGTEKLRDQAGRLAGKIAGLLEPLTLLEVDENARTALLRSEQPAKKDKELRYYEVLIRHRDQTMTAALHRYQGANASTRREPVPFVLTREALAQVVTDLAS